MLIECEKQQLLTVRSAKDLNQSLSINLSSQTKGNDFWRGEDNKCCGLTSFSCLVLLMHVHDILSSFAGQFKRLRLAKKKKKKTLQLLQLSLIHLNNSWTLELKL